MLQETILLLFFCVASAGDLNSSIETKMQFGKKALIWQRRHTELISDGH